jgi:predicted RNA-binding protein Jag
LLKITNSEKKQKSDEKILPKTNNFVDELIDDMDVCPEVDNKNGIKISDNFIKKFDEHDSV